MQPLFSYIFAFLSRCLPSLMSSSVRFLDHLRSIHGAQSQLIQLFWDKSDLGNFQKGRIFGVVKMTIDYDIFCSEDFIVLHLFSSGVSLLEQCSKSLWGFTFMTGKSEECWPNFSKVNQSLPPNVARETFSRVGENRFHQAVFLA